MADYETYLKHMIRELELRFPGSSFGWLTTHPPVRWTKEEAFWRLYLLCGVERQLAALAIGYRPPKDRTQFSPLHKR